MAWPDRDVAQFNRFGVAPSLALGLGTQTRLTASYFYQTENDMPDFGVPWYFGAPAPVPRNNYYGYPQRPAEDQRQYRHRQAGA